MSKIECELTFTDALGNELVIPEGTERKDAEKTTIAFFYGPRSMASGFISESESSPRKQAGKILEELAKIEILAEAIMLEDSAGRNGAPPYVVETWDQLPRELYCDGQAFNTRVLESRCRQMESTLKSIERAVEMCSATINNPSVGSDDRAYSEFFGDILRIVGVVW